MESNVNQEAFNHVVRALRKQNCQSFSEDEGDCTYNGPNGTHCAVGWLCYPEKVERNWAAWREEFEGWLRPEFRGVSYALIKDMQWAHDVAVFTDWWQEAQKRFRKVALKHALTFPEE